TRKVLEVDLMNDASVGRDDAEVSERVLTPAKERVTLFVARELELRIQLKRVRLAEVVDLHRVIDHELDGLEPVDHVGIPAQPDDAVTHGRKIDDARHSGEILQEHTRGHEGDLARRLALDVPARQRFDVGLLDEAVVFLAQQVFEEDLQRKRQTRNAREASMLERQQAVHVDGAAAGRQRAARPEAVHIGHDKRTSRETSSYHGRAARIESRYGFRVRNSATICATSLCSTSAA